MWVFSPGETPGAWKVGVSPGEIGGARKTGVPAQKYLLCIGRLLYKLSLSANSQEAHAMCMNVRVS